MQAEGWREVNLVDVNGIHSSNSRVVWMWTRLCFQIQSQGAVQKERSEISTDSKDTVKESNQNNYCFFANFHRFLDDSTFRIKHASVPNAQGSLCTLSPHLVDPASMERPQTLSRPVQSNFHMFPLSSSVCFFSRRLGKTFGKNANDMRKVQPCRHAWTSFAPLSRRNVPSSSFSREKRGNASHTFTLQNHENHHPKNLWLSCESSEQLDTFWCTASRASLRPGP